MIRLAIITTHPIQYNAPLFRKLAENKNIDLKVFYTLSRYKEKMKDPDFQLTIEWDIPLLEGYKYEFVHNHSKKPSTKHFFGIHNPDLIKKIIDFAPDAILVYGWNFRSHLTAIRFFKGKVPVLFRGDSTLLDYDYKTFYEIFSCNTINKSSVVLFLKYKLRKCLLSIIYKNIDYALYVGTNNKAYFKACGLKEKQLVFAPHAIDNERFFDTCERTYERKAYEWRKKLGIQDNDMVILFAGKFIKKKNPAILIKAFEKLTNSNSQISSVNLMGKDKNKPLHQDYQAKNSTKAPFSKRLSLIFVGNGPEELNLKSLSQNNANIFFLPFQNQSLMPVVYRLGDVFCLPSQGPGETWGLAVNEALASGRPALVSDKCGCAVDLIEQGKNGYIFTNNDLSLLVEQIKKLIHNNKTMKSEATRSINNYHFDVVVQNIVSLLRKFRDQ